MAHDYDLPTDQETKANEALGALAALHDMVTARDPRNLIAPEPLSYLIKVVMYSCHRAIPDGAPRHKRACNDMED